MSFDPADLARWTRFAAKGGIGICTAVNDCVAESGDDLMFLKGDEITVLLQIPESETLYLGYCEGVVGRFSGTDVLFHSKLKKPVMTKRTSVSTSSNKSPPPNPVGSPSPVPSTRGTVSLTERRPSVQLGRMQLQKTEEASYERTPSTSYSTTPTGTDSLVSTPAVGAFPAVGVDGQQTEGKVGSPSSRFRVASPPLVRVNADEGHSHTPSMSFSSTPSAPESVVSTPAVGLFPVVGVAGGAPKELYMWGESPKETRSNIASPPPTVSISQHDQDSSIPRYAANAPPPLDLTTDNSTSPLRILKRSPTSPPANHAWPLSPPATAASLEPDASYSTYEGATRRLSLGTDAEIGIGLSLLQDLANGDYSDDEDDAWSKSSRYSHETPSKAPSEANQGSTGTAEGLGHATSEDIPQNVVEEPQSRHLSPVTSPTMSSFSQGGRERRPSLAPSAGSSSSWEGAADIYDDYRYSRYSIRPSLESTRPRTDSNKSRLEKVVEYPKRTTSMDSQVSIHTRDSRLSSLSKDAVHLLSESLRPAPLDLGQNHPSPLLHTNWASPTSSTEFSDPKSSSALYTPLMGQVGPFTAAAGVALQVPTPSTSPLPPSPLSPGFASAMRQQIETNRKSSRSIDSIDPTDTLNPGANHSFDSDSTRGLGNKIVVEDEDELPSRILDDSGDFIESPSSSLAPSPAPSQSHSHSTLPPQTSERLSRASSSSPEPDLMMLHTHLAPLVVTNRTPSPSILEGGSDEGSLAGAVSALQARRNRAGGTFGGQVDEVPEHPSEIASPILPTFQLNTTVTPTVPAPPSSVGEVASFTTSYEPAPKANKRRSLFLPHPNAPKPPKEGASGPMYLAAQQPQPQPQPRHPSEEVESPRPPRPNVVGVIRMALSVPPRPGFGPPMADPRANPNVPLMVRTTPIPPRGPTIYGRTESDLALAVGPVPIIWSVDPPPATVPPPSFGPGTGMGNGGIRGNEIGVSPPKASPLSRPSTAQSTVGRSVSLGVGLKNLGETGSVSEGEGTRAPKQAESAESSGNAIPRANFSPQAPGMRPRSRSFSGFNSKNGEAPAQKSQNEAMAPPSVDVNRSRTASPLAPSSALINKSPVPKTSPLRPSPLSLPQNAVLNGGLRSKLSSSALKSPSSPLSQSMTMPSSSPPPGPSSPTIPTLNGRSLRQTASRSTLNEPTRPITMSRPMQPPGSIDSIPQTPIGSKELRNKDHPDPDSASLNNDSETRVVSPPPTVGRQNSLRSKLSLPNLRRNRSRNDEEIGIGLIAQSQHPTQPARAAQMLRVQDMKFELVRPSIPQFQAARASEDSVVLGKEQTTENGVGGSGSEHLRPDSPAVSMSSDPRSPTVEGSSRGWTPQPPMQVTSGDPSSMEAHRQRELKWISLMSSSPASQARKSKKVKKLIMDGVPSSVRYLVWSYLTDGKARCMPGVYEKLCTRGGVPSSADIERDIKNCFADQPHLQGTKGPVLLLLQAYLNMVPDVQYTMGLTLIVGQLLLLSPEEDAFWIFISIMDTHIRPYFSITTTQMEVDSALFSRALENNDTQVAKKLLVDMGINPSSICHPWFSTLFVGTLPPEYLNRVWDLFLFEGVPFLIRVGLALISCARQQIVALTNEDSVLSTLRHPPPSMLPPTPDGLISLSFSFKVKDDDIRKQRVKMEAQIKRQTQVPRSTSTSGISLPRP